MHNKTKTALILCLVLAIVGVGCVGAGIALGGKLSFRIDFKNRTVVADNSALVTGELTPEPFTTLELNVSTADVSVQRGDRWELRYALDEEPTIVQENGTLRLTDQSADSVNISFGGHTDEYVTVTIPADAAPERVTIITSTGEVSLADLAAETVNVECSTGEITLSSVTADDLNLKASTGSIDLRSVTAARHAQLETSTGEIRAQALTAPAGLTAKASTGDISLHLSGSIDYALSLRAGTGDVSVDGKNQGDSYSGSGSVSVRAETSTGDVSIWLD